MNIGDEVIYKLSSYDKFYGKEGISQRGVAEYKGKRIGTIIKVVEHDNHVWFYVIKPTRIITPKGCKPLQNCLDTARPYEVRYYGKET